MAFRTLRYRICSNSHKLKHLGIVIVNSVKVGHVQYAILASLQMCVYTKPHPKITRDSLIELSMQFFFSSSRYYSYALQQGIVEWNAL